MPLVDDGLLLISHHCGDAPQAGTCHNVSCVPLPPSSPSPSLPLPASCSPPPPPPSEARGPCCGPSAQDRAPGHVLPVGVWRRRGPRGPVTGAWGDWGDWGMGGLRGVRRPGHRSVGGSCGDGEWGEWGVLGGQVTGAWGYQVTEAWPHGGLGCVSGQSCVN